MPKSDRASLIARARVWTPTDIAHTDIVAGPRDAHGFAFMQTVVCSHSDKRLTGASPKFACEVAPGDIVKVKYGRDNPEVYAEVAATRLLWALGFGADHMYPVRVVCNGCSQDPFHDRKWHDGTVTFDPAAIERKMPGRELDSPRLAGWKWPELDEAGYDNPELRAERDALKLLASMLQHTDSRAAQQRLVCLDPDPGIGAVNCRRPFMLIDDLGMTFGRANFRNDDEPGSVDLDAWRGVPVFTNERPRCYANISRSISGTLDHPEISEGGRRFLANLLFQLSDKQIADIFEVSRMPLRMTARSLTSGTVEEWAQAFKTKRLEIASRTCE